MTTRLSILLVLSLSPILAPSLRAAAPQKPNILFIAIDDLNDWGLTALNGRKAVHTPNLDRLAARGMLFVNAHCAAPACNPSRTAILTGVAPHRSGVYTNSHDWRVNERLRDVATLPEYFRRHGYTAVGGGKIFHALEWIDGPSDGFNDAKCWDHFFPSVNRQIPPRLYPAEIPVVKGKGGPRPYVYFDWSPLDEPVEKMPDHKTVDWAIGELQKPHDKPFFQAVGLFRPHIPWYVPRRFFDLYPLDEIELPYVKPGWREKLPPAAQASGEVRRKWHRWVVENRQWKNAVQGYLASISYCDYELGRLIEALDRSPAGANTVVVLWTDHGFHLGDKETWEKFTLWAESTRVPLIVVAPGVTQPGSTCARPASLLDIYPTLLELAGLPPNACNDGISLVPWLKNPALPRERPALITNESGNHAIRSQRYHYIRYANGDEELYDMVGDEGQWNNMAGDPNYTAARAELVKWLPRENAPAQARATNGIALVTWFAVNPVAAMAAGSEPSPLRLWYEKPAAKWEEALPVGNGRLGAMVFGGTAEERLQLNESTLWGGLPHDYANPEAGQHLAELRRLIFEGKIPDAERLGGEMLGRPPFQRPYQPLGDLRLRFPGHEKAEHYVRALDLDQAVAQTSYRIGDVEFKREVFISFPDQAMVIRLSSSKPGQIAFEAGLDTPHPGIQAEVTGKDTLRLAGQLPPRPGDENWSAGWAEAGLKFEVRVRVAIEGGSIEDGERMLKVRDANAVTLVLCAATSFNNYRDISADPQERIGRYMTAACGKTFARLRQDHLADYQPLLRRVALDLGTSSAVERPTDRRIADFSKTGDPALVALYYQFGRYLLLASSRPGCQPANLQGIWNKDLWPEWSSKWTCNINVEMNYWAAETGNLPECHEPLFDLIDDLRVAGQKTAKDWYGCRGFVVHHNTDLWRGTAPVDGVQGIWPMGGVWLVQHLWEHYAFSGDQEFLRQRAYPAMKDAAQFVLDFLVEAPAGTACPGALVTNPSYSPENTYKWTNGVYGRITYAATMDLQLIGDLFDRCIAASEILGVDEEFRKQVNDARRRLPPLQIGKQGQLQEWIGDWDMEAPERHHRHVSHMYSLMPGQRIAPRETPKFAAAARKSLELRGDGGMGWSKAWKIGLWARLGEGDRALSMVEGLIKGSTLPSMLDHGPPFQIDGNLGGCAGIGEMLLQSRGTGETMLDDDGGKLCGGATGQPTIQLLPALPREWPAGSARGLCARGGFEVDCTWRDGRLTEATIHSKRGGACRVCYRDKIITLDTKAGRNYRLRGDLSKGESQ